MLDREYPSELRCLTESFVATEHFGEAENVGLHWLTYLDKHASGDDRNSMLLKSVNDQRVIGQRGSEFLTRRRPLTVISAGTSRQARRSTVAFTC